MVDAVTPKMVADFVRRLLQSKPCLAAHGDGAADAAYDPLVARYAPQQHSPRGGVAAAAAAAASAASGGGGVFERLFGAPGAAAAVGRGR
jgi:hypothetical protein